ncbi:hypothetical protein ASPZODRAFT_16821 [Penicilliopsis zonata CBS 506.65]|uniref:Uncharacterized protein n=1 Tax=Penicilliopsis zonata CBS 506.65 TaxID=1073090 RepID=A0A1L9SGD9_9EURO|nr:hypothetical protein ASPZODRAFT_16821 [Penicilliopsis zonata CBS 506.65]OJJ46226.1 hypothetical protein ASPZODRAFT_16821 [Penicilliopsis zonata CBS 506.65]
MSDSTLYLYTSLTAGSSHIVTATARIETILKANKVPFRAIDIATDDAARRLWGRKGRGKKIPGLVKFNQVVGDLEEVEEWNEYGELRMVINAVEDLDSIPADLTDSTASATAAVVASTPQATPQVPKQSTIQIQSPPAKKEKKDEQATLALRQASLEAASKAKEQKQAKLEAATASKSTTGEKVEERKEEKEEKKEEKEEKEEKEKEEETKVAQEVKRPSLISEVAAVSTADMHADTGVREHHRTSIVSATSDAEKEQVAKDLRKSISSGRPECVSGLKSEREGENEAKGTAKDEAVIKEEPEEPEAEATTVLAESVSTPGDAGKDGEEPLTQKQDPKAAEEATTSVDD